MPADCKTDLKKHLKIVQICKNVANVSRSPIVGGCLMMHLKIIYLLQKVLLEPMGMRFPL